MPLVFFVVKVWGRRMNHERHKNHEKRENPNDIDFHTMRGASRAVPKLRFPEFRDSGEWEASKLGFICLMQAGKFVSASEISEKPAQGLYPCFGGNGLRGFTKAYTNEGTYPLIGRQGALCGNIALAKGKFYATEHAVVATPMNGISTDWLYHLLINLNLNQYATGQAQPGLSVDNLNKVLARFPTDLEEQRKIADCLTSLDKVITAEAQKLDALKAHKKGLMQQFFPAEGETVPKRRFPEFRDSGEWAIQALGVVGDNLDNRRVPITEGERKKGNIPYYGASGIIDFVDDHIFDEDLLCISEDGANLVARSYPIAFSISGKTWVNNHAHVLRFQDRATQVMVENYLNSIELINFLTGMAQPKLNKAKMDSIPIPLPTIPEQKVIADCLTSLDELITAQAEKIEVLKLQKKGLMQGLFPRQGSSE